MPLFVYISKYHICIYIGRDCNCAVQRKVPRPREGSSKGSHAPKCQVRRCHGAAHCERSHASYNRGSNPARQQASQVILRNAVMIFKRMNTSFLPTYAYPNKACPLSSIRKRAEQAICILKLWITCYSNRHRVKLLFNAPIIRQKWTTLDTYPWLYSLVHKKCNYGICAGWSSSTLT